MRRRDLLIRLGLVGAAAGGAWWFRDYVLWREPEIVLPAEGDTGWLPYAEPRATTPTVAATVNGTPVRALIDSGAQYSVIDRALFQTLGLTDVFRLPMVAYGVGGDAQVGRGADDAPYRRRLPDVVGIAHEREHRAGDLGEGHQIAVDHEAAGDHAVVRHELPEQLGDRRAGPCDPAVGLQEAALVLPWQQRLTIVQTAQEVDAAAHRLHRIQELEAGARHPIPHPEIA